MSYDKPLESKLQARCITKLKACGWLVVKLMLTNKPGIPDTLIMKDGRALFIEFKRRGEFPTPLQKSVHDKIKSQGFMVMIVDDINKINILL